WNHRGSHESLHADDQKRSSNSDRAHRQKDDQRRTHSTPPGSSGRGSSSGSPGYLGLSSQYSSSCMLKYRSLRSYVANSYVFVVSQIDFGFVGQASSQSEQNMQRLTSMS